MRLQHRVAVVTGAASGIGRAIARSLARRGCNLALADIDSEGLAETGRLALNGTAKVSLHQLDVADRQAVASFPQIVHAAHGRVDLLVNNAGVALKGTFDEVAEEDFEWLVNINFWGVVRMTRAFLPQLKASDEARIVNLSSIFGLIAMGGHAAYSASKFAVRGFSIALMQELEDTNVGVTVVYPGGVGTGIAERARGPKTVAPRKTATAMAGVETFLGLAPEIAGEIIVRGVERGRPRVLVGRDAHAVAAIEAANLATLMRRYGEL
jgi:NADP-dependent 3-hydroxy acid dehydrogenase YdfG